MMKSTKTQQNKLMKIIKMPIKALAKARDFYVKSMNTYADRACYGGGVSYYADPLPRSFSTTPSNRSNNDTDDFRELVRAASTSTLANRINLNSVVIDHNNNHSNNNNSVTQQNLSNGGVIKGVPRSASVGMAKIEEDKPIDFNDNFKGFGVNDDEINNGNKFGVFPRSRSYAVGATKRNSNLF